MMDLRKFMMTPEEREEYMKYLVAKHPNVNLDLAKQIQGILIISDVEPDAELTEALRYLADAIDYGREMFEKKQAAEKEKLNKHINN